MNILLTNECNRKCPYCFAGERISFTTAPEHSPGAEAPRFISRDRFEHVLEFARKSGLKRISLLGGEPSIHPEFTQLVELAWSRDLHVTVFTNGIWPRKSLPLLESVPREGEPPLNLTVNINEPGDTPAGQRQGQHELLSRAGRLASLSFNIYREDFDPSFLVDTITRYGLRKNVRLGVAVPLARHESKHVAVDRYKDLAPTILALAKLCDAEDIRLGFDCGFVFCMFDSSELGLLQSYGARFKSSCGPAIDVGTDLSVWSCFPLSTFSKGVDLDRFEDVDGLAKHFNHQFGRLIKAGTLDDCAGCKYRRRGQCTGGCAAHVYRRINA